MFEISSWELELSSDGRNCMINFIKGCITPLASAYMSKGCYLQGRASLFLWTLHLASPEIKAVPEIIAVAAALTLKRSAAAPAFFFGWSPVRVGQFHRTQYSSLERWLWYSGERGRERRNRLDGDWQIFNLPPLPGSAKMTSDAARRISLADLHG